LFFRHIIIIASLLWFSAPTFGQTEAEMKTKADAFFENANFLEATPLYLRLLSLKPRDFDYNYRYGTCLLFNSNNKKEAIKHLNYAVSNPSVVPETYYYLGKAYHLNYQFSEAIKYYEKYIGARAKPAKAMDAERDIEMCRNGKQLLTTLTDIIVQEKKEIGNDKFFRVYELNDLGGNFLVTADFQTKTDKKNGHTPLIYYPQEPSVIYYSSYGENESKGKDIYFRRKNSDGTWGEAQLAEGDVNTFFDEDFPYMHPDGEYLYFSSKGHNSMGGYDVFRCKIDAATGKFGPAENLDFAISSPDDDLLYVVDADNRNAWFASARQSQDGKLQVYKVKVERVPIQLVAIKGDFVSELDPGMKKVSIEVRDVVSGQLIGTFNSNEKAIYQITFPKGGRYEYAITFGTSGQQKAVVTIPYMKEFKPLKQRILHKVNTDGAEQIVIINQFDEEVDDPQAIIADVIMKRSELNVNADQFDLGELADSQKNREVLNELGIGNLLPNEVADLLNRELQKTKDQLKLQEAIENNVRTLVVENAKEFARLEEEIKDKVTEANSTSEKREKYILLREADEMIKSQKELNAYSSSLLRLNDSIDGVFSSSQAVNAIIAFEQALNQFNDMLLAGDEKGAFEVISQNKEAIQKVLNDESLELVPNLVAKSVLLDEENRIQQKKIDTYSDDIRKLEISVQSLQNSVYMAKKKDLPGIQANIASKQEEIRLITEERALLMKKVDNVSLEKSRLSKQISIIQDAISNKSVVSVSKDQARNALATTQKVNSNTLTSYVEQQISKMEAEDPSLRESVFLASGRTTQTIYSEYVSSVKAVQEDTNLAPEEKLYKSLSIERNSDNAFNVRLKEIEVGLEDDPSNTSLEDEKRSLKSYQKELQNNILGHERQVELLLANQKGGTSKEILTNEIDPGYDEEIAAIENNDALSAIEKERARQAADQKLNESIVIEKAEVAEKLKADPDNASLKDRNAKLTTLQTETNQRIESRETELAQFDPQRQDQRKVELSKSINPKYLDQRTQIAQNSTLSSSEKLSALQNLDEVFIAKVEQAIADNTVLLAQDPNNKINQQKDIDLKSLRDDYAKQSAERKVAIESLEAEESRTTLLVQIDPKHTNQINTIESNSQLSEQEKIKQLKAIEEQFLTKLTAEKEKNSSILNTNALDEKALVRDGVLTNEIKQQQERITELDERFIANTSSPVDTATLKRELAENIDAGYDKERVNITTNKELSPSEKLTALQNLDKGFVEKVNAAIIDNNKLKSQDPFNVSYQQKAEGLNSLKTEKSAEIEERTEKIESLTSQVVAREILESIDPEYTNRKSTIDNNSTLTADQKAASLLAVEQERLAKLQTERERIETALSQNPTDEKLLASQAIIENQTEAQEKTVQSLNARQFTKIEPVTEASVLTSLNPEYEDKRSGIISNSATEKDKLEALLVLDNALLDQVKATKIEVASELNNSNGNDQKLKNKLDILSTLEREIEQGITKNESDLKKLTSTEVASESFKSSVAEVDPTYEKDIASININATYSELDKNKRLQARDQQLLTQLNKEIEALEEKRQANLDLTSITTAIEGLQVEKDLTENRMNERAQVLAASTPEVQDNTKKARNQSEVLTAVMPGFDAQLKAITSSTKSDADQLTEEIELRKSLVAKLEKERQALEKQVAKDATNVTAIEEIRTVDAAISEQKQSITEKESDLANVKSGVLSVGSPVSTTEKQSEIKKIAPEYKDDLTNRQNKTLDQIDAAFANEMDLNERIIEQLEAVLGQLNSSPNSTPLQRENEVLMSLLNENNQRISSLQNEKASLQNLSITQADKDRVIDALDPQFRTNRDVLSKNINELTTTELDNSIYAERELLSLVFNRLAELKEQNGVEATREKAILEVLSDDLQADIAKRQDVVKERNAAMFSAEEKLFAINSLSPDYIATVSSVEASSLSDQEKKVAQIDNEKQLLRRIYPAIEAQDKIVNDNPDNAQVKRQLALLEQLLFESQDRLKALDSDGEQAAISAQAMTDQLMSDYTSRRAVIVNDSKMNDLAKETALLNLEQELLELVEEEIFRMQDVIGMANDSDENSEKFETLNALRSLLNSSIAEHKETINRPNNDSVVQEQKEQLLVDVMPDYLSRLADVAKSSDGAQNTSNYSKQQDIERELITQLNAEKNQVVKQLKKNPEDEQLMQRQSLVEALIVEHTEEIARIENEKTQADVKAIAQFIESLRSTSLGNQQDALVEEYSTLAEVKAQDQLLQSYEKTLNAKLSDVNAQLKKQADNPSLIGKRDAIVTELDVVKNKRRNVLVTIGKLETERIVETETEIEDPELQSLANEKEKVERSLQSQNLTNQEEKKLNKELQTIETLQLEREVELQTAENTSELAEVKSIQSELKQQSALNSESQKTIESAVVSSNTELNRAEKLKEEADMTKDPAAQKFLLEQSAKALVNAQEILVDAQQKAIENQIEQTTGAQLDTEESLTTEIREETNRVNQLKTQLKESELELATARRKDKETLLAKQLDIKKELALLNESIELKTTERDELREEEKVLPVIDEKALETEIMQETERQIASSREYAEYYANVNQALEVEQQIATLEAQLAEKKSAVRRKVQVYAGELTTERIEELNRDATEISSIETELESLRLKLETLRTEAENEINLAEDMRLKMQNLVLRGIAPIDKLAVIASLVSLPANGLTINNTESTIPATERRIPVNVQIPSGLVYRVQIGAFAKPIAADRFSEFNPVSGEKLNNGVTRYLAGYFNNSKRVVEARDQIKALGYADAFAVAYCDGKRITLAEARVMEANGTCVALGENELNLQLAANTAASLGIDTSTQLAKIIERDLTLRSAEDGDTTKKQSVQNYTYNQAPGAAPADAIEKVKGLFFTVQIGVFNKPVSAEVLYDLSPLMTVRLPNGQIRYSVGMFITVDEARVKKLEAIDRGAADAFVTAYFDGERITVAEAQKMLDARGNFSNTSLLTAVPYPTNPTVTPKEKTTSVKPKKSYDGIQIVTKKTFNEYPVDVLNRYNARGSFYFDETDKRVKSVIYPNEDALPQVSYFKEDIDTLRLLRSEFNTGVTIAMDITTGSFDGEFTDWLLRQNYRRELVQTEEMRVLRLCNIPEDRLTVITEYLTRIGINYTVLK
jgi:hypothetical protein